MAPNGDDVILSLGDSEDKLWSFSEDEDEKEVYSFGKFGQGSSLAYYCKEEWADLTRVKKNWFSRAKLWSKEYMLERAKEYKSQDSISSRVESVKNPKSDFKHILYNVGKEHSSKIQDLINKSYNADAEDGYNNVDPRFLKDLHRYNMKVFLSEVVLKRG